MNESGKGKIVCDNVLQRAKHFKKMLCLVLSLVMLFSITSAIPITAEAATQNALWFMDDLKITQVPGGDYSHKGTQNFDVVGVKNNNIKAPFDCKIVKIHKGELYGNTVIIESTSKVLYADGTTDYMSMCFAHDNDISDLSVGKTLKQGQVFYQTGTYGNAAGRHSHVTVIKGKYKNDMWTKNSYGNYCSPNAINPTKGLFITDITNVVDSKGLSFKKINYNATCTIAYNANGGVGSIGTSTVKYNNKFTLAANKFSKAGYTFGGWNVCRKSDNKWFTTNGNGWQTASNISSKGYTKKVYKDCWSGTLDSSWFSTIKNDTYTFYAIWICTHSWNSGSVTKSATCKATGTKTYTCTKCKATKTETIAKSTKHSNKTTTTKATTSKNGSIVTKCTVCGNVSKNTTIAYPKTITLSASSYTYDGKVKTPSVTVKDSNGKKIASNNYTISNPSGRKNVGTYTVTITFKGNYSGSVKKSFTIKPKSTTVSSVSAASKAFTIKWKKQASQTNGYQIQYSTSSNFNNAKTVTVSKNSTTSKKITGLVGKTKYYVRVRTYKTVGNSKVYSGWSASKTVTTKK